MKSNLVLEAPDDALVCYCAKVSKGEIVKAIKDGHTSFERLRAATGLCPEHNDCPANNPHGRCCSPEVMALIRSVVAENVDSPGCGCCES